MEQAPYWITQNLRTIPDSLEAKELIFFTTSQVIDGKSPLGTHGKNILYQSVIRDMTPNKEVWIFPKTPLDCEVAHRVGQLFRLITKIKNDLNMTKSGTLLYTDSEVNVVQPPQYENYRGTCSLREFNVEDADKAFKLSRWISSSPDYIKHLIQFNYLKELRCTDPFLGYLGLWSFIEIEWSKTPNKTDLQASMKNLLQQYFQKNKVAKKDFNARLKSISLKVGEIFDERSIRNLLAHGKYHYAMETWEPEDNTEFHNIHDELFAIMFSSLEQRILS